MSQNLRNTPADSEANGSGRTVGRNAGGQYEGFEGMNFEQQRQPYNPQPASQEKKEGKRTGEGQRRDDL